MFIKLILEKDLSELFVRPLMVKAVLHEKDGVSRVIVDGHDYLVVGSPMDIMHLVDFDITCVDDPHPEPGRPGI